MTLAPFARFGAPLAAALAVALFAAPAALAQLPALELTVPDYVSDTDIGARLIENAAKDLPYRDSLAFDASRYAPPVTDWRVDASALTVNVLGRQSEAPSTSIIARSGRTDIL